MKNDDKNYYNSINSGLNESLEYSKGKLPSLKRRKVSISPIPKYDASKIRQIRLSLNLSQTIFAEALGVSIKTVEAWESGRNRPQGPASRFLQLLEMDGNLLENHNILSV